MEDIKTKKFATELESEKPEEVTTVAADSSETEKSAEVAVLTPDSSTTEKPVKVAELKPEKPATEKTVDVTTVTQDSSSIEKPVEFTAMKPDSSATGKAADVTTVTQDSSPIKKPVELTARKPDSSATGKAAEVKAVASDSLAAKTAMTDHSTTEPTSSEASSKLTVSESDLSEREQDSEKPTRRRVKKDSMMLKRSRSMGLIVKWSLSTYFDINPAYFLQLRGIMNVLHLIISMLILILLGESCRFYAHDRTVSDGFFCRSVETFLFVTAVSGFLMSVLYFFCCLLSKKTEQLLYYTTLEVSYFILYAVLYIIAACSVVISEDLSNLKIKTSYNYKLSYGAGVLGVINGIFYAVSAVAFFLTHRHSRQTANREPI